MIYSSRISRLRAEMQAAQIDFLLLTPSTDLFYLTGMRGKMMERLVCVLISQEDIHFISPQFELGNLKPETRSLFSCHGWTDGENPFDLADRLLPHREKTLAVGGQVPSWVLLPIQALRPAYHFCSGEMLMRSLRMIKDEEEYRLLKLAHERSDRAFLKFLEHDICGMTEYEAGKLLNGYLDAEGIDRSSGNVPLVCAGPNGALPHHSADQTVIKPGDAVVIDYGGANKQLGYYTDTTRTIAVKYASDELREVYDVVNRANQAAFETAKPGTMCCDVDRAARDLITKAGYGDFFTHRVGHGLGLDAHEHPYLSHDVTYRLEAGNVCSDEPGIYLPGKFGVRIEDTLFIRENGAERLTLLDHTLHILQ